MTDSHNPLQNFQKKHDYLIAIDSDGCAFDSMEIKHKECFIPNIIKYFNVQSISRFVRASAEFVNLYSKWRGINRFPALVKTFDLLVEWDEVKRRNPKLPNLEPLREWMKRETKLGNPTLKKEVEKIGDPVLKLVLIWSEAVNRTIEDMVYGIPPFPFVRETLESVSQWADVLVCSQTPEEALRREWAEHGIDKYVNVIAGQELGSKKEHIAIVANGRYDKDKIIMIGDAFGDLDAARANGAYFFPINPGDEDKSWEMFYKTAANLFRAGKYDKDYEAKLLDDFFKRLPETPPWKK